MKLVPTRNHGGTKPDTIPEPIVINVIVLVPKLIRNYIVVNNEIYTSIWITLPVKVRVLSVAPDDVKATVESLQTIPTETDGNPFPD